MDRFLIAPRSRNPSAPASIGQRARNPSASDLGTDGGNNEPDCSPEQPQDILEEDAHGGGGHGSRSSSSCHDVSKDWTILKPFYKQGVGRDSGHALCLQKSCAARLKLQKDTNFNLARHFQILHPAQYPALKAAINGISKRGRRPRSQSGGSDAGRDAKSQRQGCIEDAIKVKFDQHKALDLFYEVSQAFIVVFFGFLLIFSSSKI